MPNYRVILMSPIMEWEDVTAPSKEEAIKKCSNLRGPLELDPNEGPYHWHVEEEELIIDMIIETAYDLYQQYGQGKVEEYGRSLNLPFKWCGPCESMEPIYRGACLVCGTEQEEEQQ